MRISNQLSGEAVTPLRPETQARLAKHDDTLAAERWTSFHFDEAATRLPDGLPPAGHDDAPSPEDTPAAPRDPMVRALHWVWRQIVISFAAYGEAVYPGMVYPADYFYHYQQETESPAFHQTHDLYQIDATQTFVHSPWASGPAAPFNLPDATPSPKPRRSVIERWSAWRRKRAMKATIAKLQVRDDYY